MTKSHLLIFMAFLLALAGCIENNNKAGSETKSIKISEEIRVEVAIFNGTSTISKSISALKGSSALEAFERVANISKKTYPFGSYVYGINGRLENENRNGKYWQYYADGEIVMVAADNFKITKYHRLEFKYEAQNPQIK